MASESDLANLKLNGKDLKQEALKLCGEFLGSPWDTIALSDFKISALSGGFMNCVYRCSLPDHVTVENPKTPRQILLRVYGAFQEEEGAVVTQTATFMLLAERKLGPKLYGIFPNGRLEEYIPSRNLTTKDMHRMYTFIARKVAKIHALDVPVKKYPDFFPRLSKRWLSEIEANNIQKYNKIFPLLNFFKEELEWLMKEVEQSQSPVVYCHNDLTGGNILLKHDSPSVKEPNLVVIDFELACYNYRGFDIALLFCESTVDYNTPDEPHFTIELNKYPSEKQQIEFIEVYLDQLVLEKCVKPSSIDEEKERILREVKLFNVAVHLYVALWCEKMNFISNLDFNYPAHSEARIKLFKIMKEKYLQTR